MQEVCRHPDTADTFRCVYTAALKQFDSISTVTAPPNPGRVAEAPICCSHLGEVQLLALRTPEEPPCWIRPRAPRVQLPTSQRPNRCPREPPRQDTGIWQPLPWLRGGKLSIVLPSSLNGSGHGRWRASPLLRLVAWERATPAAPRAKPHRQADKHWQSTTSTPEAGARFECVESL